MWSALIIGSHQIISWVPLTFSHNLFSWICMCAYFCHSTGIGLNISCLLCFPDITQRANTKCWSKAGLMLAHHLRRCANIEPALGGQGVLSYDGYNTLSVSSLLWFLEWLVIIYAVISGPNTGWKIKMLYLPTSIHKHILSFGLAEQTVVIYESIQKCGMTVHVGLPTHGYGAWHQCAIISN